MKTLYVGGNHFFNRFGNLEAAVERAEHDDIIEICKDLKNVKAYINKNITINGNGHTITPMDGKTALDCASYVTLKQIRFDCKPRTNAAIIRNGGNLSDIKTRVIGPARAVYPTVVQRGGDLVISHSEIMQIETYESHGDKETTTLFETSVLTDYYGGYVYLEDNDYSISKFRGKTTISDSVIMCALLNGTCELKNTVLKNFNKAKGAVRLISCELRAEKRTDIDFSREPSDGPLKNQNPNVIPYALHIAGGRVTAENFSSGMRRDCIGFYMTSGSLEIRATNNSNDEARHLIKGGAVVFNDVTDNGFYEIKKARCGVIRSQVNTSMESQTAMQQLDAMIGLNGMKKQLHTIMNTISVNMRCPEKDFGFSHHMVFAGDPGTGKTTVAKLAAQALFEIGAIPENKFMEVPASQLVKGYVGQTGEHVEAIMQKALGGVIFIDEAYELMIKDGQATFNNDVLSVLLRYMEDHRGELVVIAAGYEKEMRQFLASNVGLSRRFQWVSFADYTPAEMADIFLSMCNQYKEEVCVPEKRAALTDFFGQLTNYYLSHPDANGRVTNGGNGGLVRNVFQQVIFARNNRIAERPDSSMLIAACDLETGFMEEMKKAMNVTY